VSSVAVADGAAAIDFCSRGRGFSLIISFSGALADSFLSRSSCFEEWDTNHTKAPKRIPIQTMNRRRDFHIFNISFFYPISAVGEDEREFFKFIDRMVFRCKTIRVLN
jgi:hypothetical protein